MLCSKAAFYVFNGNIDRSIWKWGKSQQCDACVSLHSESLVCQTQLPAQETEHILYFQPWELCPHTCMGWRPPGTRVKQFCFSHPKNDAAGSSARGFDALLTLQVGPGTQNQSPTCVSPPAAPSHCLRLCSAGDTLHLPCGDFLHQKNPQKPQNKPKIHQKNKPNPTNKLNPSLIFLTREFV